MGVYIQGLGEENERLRDLRELARTDGRMVDTPTDGPRPSTMEEGLVPFSREVMGLEEGVRQLKRAYTLRTREIDWLDRRARQREATLEALEEENENLREERNEAVRAKKALLEEVERLSDAEQNLREALREILDHPNVSPALHTGTGRIPASVVRHCLSKYGLFRYNSGPDYGEVTF